jgi:hypothetical protein
MELVDELETADSMAVHAYLHREEGNTSNADCWYHLAGRGFQRPTLDGEWKASVDYLGKKNSSACSYPGKYPWKYLRVRRIFGLPLTSSLLSR